MGQEEAEQAKTKEQALQNFRVEIGLKKEAEMARKAESGGKSYDTHFDDIDPLYLEQEDYEVYRDLELMDAGTFRRLRHERLAAFSDKPGENEDERHKSVKMFWAYITNLFDSHTYNRMQLEGKLSTDSEDNS